MPRVELKPDTLDVINGRFEQSALNQPLFLNSVPKSGSHLLRNIFRMFVPLEQHYGADFVQHATLGQHRVAFDAAAPRLSWGHLPFSDAAAIVLSDTRKILLVRDPYDWVLARARFFLSDAISGNLDHLKLKSISIEQLLNLMIFGIVQRAPGLQEIYTHTAIAWLGTDIHLVRYEQLREHSQQLESDSAREYFARLFSAGGIALPDDWRDRVRSGADPAQSGTARTNLTVKGDIPDLLPQSQRELVDYAAPGLRSLLGYA